MSEGRLTITGSMNAAESSSDFIAQPTEAQGYLVAARGMLEGAIPLGQRNPVPPFALTLLCGHACESALKAILAKSGISANALSSKPIWSQHSYPLAKCKCSYNTSKPSA